MQKKRSKQPFFHTSLIVRRRPGTKHLGIIQAGNLTLRCALGRSGITAFKCEGDGATPLATMPILSGFCKEFIPPHGRCGLPLRKSRIQDGWCDEAGDANYNRPVTLPYPASAETMRRDDALYDIGFVLDWNISTRCQGRGSAIFLHLARQNEKGGLCPTQGCIALVSRDMRRLIPYLKRGRKIITML